VVLQRTLVPTVTAAEETLSRKLGLLLRLLLLRLLGRRTQMRAVVLKTQAP
jgi:hypothetical protein